MDISIKDFALMNSIQQATFASRIILSVFLVSFISACGGGGGGDSTPTPPPANVAPTANAGADQAVDEETTVTLSGSGADSDGSISSYSWSQTAGNAVTLSNVDTAAVTFDAPTLIAQTTLTFQLVVTDDDGATNSDTVDIVVNPVNIDPTVNAGDDQTVDAGENVDLAATGSDSDGSIAIYTWEQTQGTQVTITNPNNAQQSFIAPSLSQSEVLIFRVTVTDNEGAEGSDTVEITVNANTLPIADAGAGQFVTSGDIVTLDASASTDAESSLTYSWLQTDSTGISITLDDTDVEQPAFTAPDSAVAVTVMFEVTVTDTGGLNDTATVNIAVAPVISQKINDTGIVLCSDYPTVYGNGSFSEDCSDKIDANGDPIPEGQDADYGRDFIASDTTDGSAGFSFTKLDTDGNPLPHTATSWSCVLDNVTKLIWEVKTTDGGLQDATNTYTWYNSTGINDGEAPGTADGGSCPDTGNCDTEKYVASVNASNSGSGLCGVNNWQLPNKEQLRSIIDYSIDFTDSQDVVVIDQNYFPNTVPDPYWTLSPYSLDSTQAWAFNFHVNTDARADKSQNIGIRLVSQQ